MLEMIFDVCIGSLTIVVSVCGIICVVAGTIWLVKGVIEDFKK